MRFPAVLINHHAGVPFYQLPTTLFQFPQFVNRFFPDHQSRCQVLWMRLFPLLSVRQKQSPLKFSPVKLLPILAGPHSAPVLPVKFTHRPPFMVIRSIIRSPSNVFMAHSSGLSASPRCGSTLSGDQQSGAAPPAAFCLALNAIYQEPADPLLHSSCKIFA